MYVLEISDLRKNFGKLEVIKNLNMKVAKNSIFGFLGKNGAGKTTTLRMITGMLRPDGGSISVCGETVRFGSSSTNRHIGFLPDTPEFYGHMTPKEYLMLCARVCGIKPEDAAGRINELLTAVGLDGVNRRVKGFSRGMKQRLGIAQALVNDPELVLCDEPTSALDPAGRKEILDILKSLRNKTTIVFSTHILADVERICDSIGILHNGKLVIEGNLADVKKTYASESIAVQIHESEKSGVVAEELLKTEEVASAVLKDNGIIQVITRDAIGTGNKISRILSENNLSLARFEILEPDLEDIFLRAIKQ
ncbi:MAG: ABC transporter ATP-binding protein [Clostridiaceae bacterium]|nr:ABC transporter ATP-binding protein [Clostridiaceae bacterium]